MNNQTTQLSKIYEMKQQGQKISALSVPDAAFAHSAVEANIDLLFVDDTMGAIAQELSDVTGVTSAQMCYHTEMVSRGAQNSVPVVSSMPFMTAAETAQSLQVATELARAGADLIKIEVTSHRVPLIQQIIDNGIAVCGHVGVQPQALFLQGGYQKRGVSQQQIEDIFEAALSLEKVGASLLYVLGLDEDFASKLAYEVHIPVIGADSGKDIDGQLVSIWNLLGIDRSPYASTEHSFFEEAKTLPSMISSFVQAVQEKKHPS